MDPENVQTKFEIRSFTRSWDNRGYLKTLGSPGEAHAPFRPKFLVGFCSDGPCECMNLNVNVNLKSVALPFLR